jgi:hypothetical protein
VASSAAAGRAKADRCGDALADGDAVVSPARRQVEHVAGIEQPLGGRRELGEHLQRHVVAQPRVGHAADAPAAASRRLQQEDVVRIDVRPDAATVARPRAHHVVEARVGDEAKAPEEAVRVVVVEVDALDEHGPARAPRGQRRRRDRAVANRPARAGAHDETRLDAFARGEREQARAVDARERAGQRVANEERLFCQCRRMKAEADRPPRRVSFRSACMRHCAMIVRWKSLHRASSA